MKLRTELVALVQPLLRAAARALPLLLAGGVLLAVAGQAMRPTFHTVDVLVDLPLPIAWACVAQLLLAAALLVRPGAKLRRPLVIATLSTLTIFAAVAVIDTVRYYALWAAGDIAPRRLLPLSSYIALILGLRMWQWLRAARSAAAPARLGRRRLAAAVACIALGAFCLPLAEQCFFGSTEYSHQADAAVVFGAGVYANGRPSHALRDRVATGVALYKSGRCRTLVMTGGIDPNHGHSEAAIMRQLAIDAGVPAEAILLDERGVNTQASVDNLHSLLANRRLATCLMVSHDYHLPRIKRLADRAGLRCWTVPAHETRRLQAGPIYRLRELAAWHYYLLGLPGR